MTCEKWWTRKLSKIAEHDERAFSYCVRYGEYAFALLFKCRLKAFEAQRKANIDYLKSMIIANIAEPEEQLSLFERG